MTRLPLIWACMANGKFTAGLLWEVWAAETAVMG
jgi:hypothetical protein